jgi:hypothetical protein
VRGPVGSLARPEAPADADAFDAGSGVTVFVERRLLDAARDGRITFQFGLLGRCTGVIDPPASGPTTPHTPPPSTL